MAEKENMAITSTAADLEHEKRDEEQTVHLLTGLRLALVFVSFGSAFFLIALDQTIISTALPTIASHFNAVADLSWIASAYFLPQAGLMTFVGKLLSVVAAKPIFLSSVAIFEVGSLLCAVAPSVKVLIFGRAVAGVGASGLWISIMSIMAQITTMKQRPVLMGLFGAIFAVSSITGPLIGGVFAEKVTWRWCFYINLPIGGLATILVIFLLPYIKAEDSGNSSLLTRLQKMDWFGAFLSLSTPTMLLLALQWGGNEKPWNDQAVITTLVLFCVLLPLFIWREWKQDVNAVMPLRLFKERSMSGSCIAGFLAFISFTLTNYYLPLLYQVKGHSATNSGIDIIPFMATGVFAALTSGGVISKTGRPWSWLFFSPMLASVSFGLLYTAKDDLSFKRLASYQVLTGLGLGPLTQTPVVVVQGIFASQPKVVPQATAIVTVIQLLGSSISLAIGQAILSNLLKTNIDKLLPGIPEDLRSGVLASITLAFTLPEEMKLLVLRAYTLSVANVFLIGVPATALGSMSAWLITRKKIILDGDTMVQ